MRLEVAKLQVEGGKFRIDLGEVARRQQQVFLPQHRRDRVELGAADPRRAEPQVLLGQFSRAPPLLELRVNACVKQQLPVATQKLSGRGNEEAPGVRLG